MSDLSEKAPKIWLGGKLAVTNLRYAETFGGKGVRWAALGSTATVTDIYSDSPEASVNELSFYDLTLSGDITVTNPGSTIKLKHEKVRTPATYNAYEESNANYKLVLGKDSKLAAIKKASLENVKDRLSKLELEEDDYKEEFYGLVKKLDRNS